MFILTLLKVKSAKNVEIFLEDFFIVISHQTSTVFFFVETDFKNGNENAEKKYGMPKIVKEFFLLDFLWLIYVMVGISFCFKFIPLIRVSHSMLSFFAQQEA